MSEAIQSQPIQSPLAEIHRRLGATMSEQDGWSTPASYGDVSAEYGAVRDGGAGLIDLSSRGRVLVTGSESLQFLNGLITNDMKTLEQNRWMPAAFPNVQGRLLASVRVMHQAISDNANGFLIDTESTTHDQVLKTVQRFTFAGDFHVEDLTNRTALLSLQGSGSAAIMATIFGTEAGALERHQILLARWQDQTVSIIRATHTGEDGFDLLVSDAAAVALWEALVAPGTRAVGFEALEILRIEAGLPRFGIDMDETNVVTEIGLDEAVSFTKGCYIGQEIIARIKYRGHVAKKLSGLLFDGPASIDRGSKVKTADDKEIGRVTSATFSPRLGRAIALGYVKYDYLAPGTEVMVAAPAGEFPAKVVELPFLHGSWLSG